MKDGGNKKGVARVEATTLGRTRVVKKIEGSTTGTDTTGGATCRD